MKVKTRISALCLSALLLLPGSALASGETAAEPLTAAQKQADLDLFYATLRERHPSLYANTPEEAFLSKKADLEGRLDGISDLDFTFELQSLAALVGDSHTSATLSSDVGMRFFPISLNWYEGAWVLTTVDAAHASKLGETVSALNGYTMEEVLARFSTFVSADNEVKLRRQARQIIYAENILSFLGLAESGAPLELTLMDAAGRESVITLEAYDPEALEGVELSRLSASVPQKPITAPAKGKYYDALPLDQHTYYIQYNRCQEDPELPMEGFAAQVQSDLESGAYSQILLDLRNNGGGSDGVLVPILNLLAPMVRDGRVQLCGLIGETTFSSAVINAVMIREMGGILAGSPTSGSVDHFGSVGSFELPNSGLRVGCSSKWISLSGLLEGAQGYGVEALRPDVAVEQTLRDYLSGKDTLVDYLLAHPGALKSPDRDSLSLTRGYFVDLLCEAGGQGGDPAVLETGFSDVMPFAYYTPAVYWAKQEGLALGNGDGAFEAARPLTRAEAAVLLVRAADQLGITLAGGGTETSFTDETAIPSWALDSAKRAGGSGLIDTQDGAFRPDGFMTRLDGARMVRTLFGT